MSRIIKGGIVPALIIGTFLFSCTKKNEEDLLITGSNCDISSVSFASEVVPLIELHCQSGCHDATSQSAGIILETYQQIKDLATTGSLFGVINHDVGFTPMPLLSPKLNECDIETIKVWVDEGLQNN